jgi:ribose 5-phosphate isomerase B
MSTKPFDIITEADARVLARGTTVRLAGGGHVTPLAADTLRERRITVVHDDGGAAGDESLAPPSDIRRVVIGNDHTGIALKQAIVAWLRGRGLTVLDVGTNETAAWTIRHRRSRRAPGRPGNSTGIAIDGAGIGSAIAANKVGGIRAATATDERVARYAREHNGANVLALGATLLAGADEAVRIVDTWLRTPMREPRYLRRLLKIRRLEQQARS